MADLRFDWDETKNVANQRKHGVSFEEAQTVFFDEHAVQFFDEDALGEDRIISARKPTKMERSEYPEES